jgi:hypothetical protein
MNIKNTQQKKKLVGTSSKARNFIKFNNSIKNIHEAVVEDLGWN